MRSLHNLIETKIIGSQLRPILTHIDECVASIQTYLIESKKAIDQYSKGTKKRSGVYAFFITPKTDSVYLKNFESLWTNNETELKNYTKVVASRFKESTEKKKDFYTLYIGKSEKIETRIHEHLNHENNSKTYGLKLRNREVLKNEYTIEYAFYEINNEENLDKSIIQFIITRIEQQLRTKMLPWVGKQ